MLIMFDNDALMAGTLPSPWSATALTRRQLGWASSLSVYEFVAAAARSG